MLLLNLIIIICLIQFYGCTLSPDSKSFEKDSSTNDDPDLLAFSKFPLKMYQILFNSKRHEHWDAIKQIQRQTNKEKRDRLILALVDGMVKVFKQTRLHIERSGFFPGSPFPDDTQADLKEALSQTLENAAFISDLILHFPDIVLKEYFSKNELRLSTDWAILFSNQTEFYDEKATKLMHLVGQELGLIEKESTYVNPYSSSSSKKQPNRATIEDEYKKKIEKEKLAKKEAKRKKGPRLQRGTKSEL